MSLKSNLTQLQTRRVYKPYIDPGAAHCWPISVQIWFGFKLYISNIKTLTKGAFLSQTKHTLMLFNYLFSGFPFQLRVFFFSLKYC
jgi:hypothetical protein